MSARAKLFMRRPADLPGRGRPMLLARTWRWKTTNRDVTPRVLGAGAVSNARVVAISPQREGEKIGATRSKRGAT